MSRPLRWISAATLVLLATAGLGILALRSDEPALPPARRTFTLTNVALVDPGLRRRNGMDLEVHDGRIARIAPSASEAPERWVLPGFVDVHVHHFPPFDDELDLMAGLHLMHGVTTVRNLAAPPGIFAYARDVDEGRRIGPRVVACGTPLDGRPMIWLRTGALRALGRFVGLRSGEEARAAVREQARAGAACIKIAAAVSAEQLAAAREEAHAHGLPLVGHVPQDIGLEQAALDEIEHLTGVPDVRPGAFTVEGDFLPWLRAWPSLTEARTADVITSARAAGTAHAPTLVLWQKLQGFERPSTDSELLPLALEEAFFGRESGVAPWAGVYEAAFFDAVRAAFPHMLDFVGALRSAGVPVLVGTDSVLPGAAYHRELALLVEAGFTPAEALAAATRLAGERLGMPGRGLLEEGAHADLLVFAEDPTRDLRALRTLELVVVDGRPYDVATLRDAHERRLERTRRLGARLRTGITLRLASAFFGLGR